LIFCTECGTSLDKNSKFCSACGTPTINTNKPDNKPSPAHLPDNNLHKTVIRSAPQYGLDVPKITDNITIIDNRYEVKEKLGQGGFGSVYRVYDKKMEIDKAIKILSEEVVNDRAVMASLRREAQIMVRLNHPAIVRIFDFNDNGTIKYLDMEYVNGSSLYDIKLDAPEGRLAETSVIDYALQISDGLLYAHSQNVIHKDIKPQNILITGSGDIKIMDFGISETLHNQSRISPAISAGTLVYMSPEQIKGKDLGAEADIYSFGAMLYELVSGYPPFYKGAIENRILTESPAEIEGVSQSFNAFLQKCLKKDYRERPRGFDNISKALTNGSNKITISPSQRTTDYEKITNEAGMTFVGLPAGSFLMGSTFREPSRRIDERQHKVTLSTDFYIQTTPVTQKQWTDVMGTQPWRGDPAIPNDPDCPVNMISWNDCREFIYRLNTREYTNTYRLPTEAEWEYACRAGCSNVFCFGEDPLQLTDFAWFEVNAYDLGNRHSHSVAQKKQNAFGLYDMHGNVWEWCEDIYGFYPSGHVINPKGSSGGDKRVKRGGAWNTYSGLCRSANRHSAPADVKNNRTGFRVVKDISQA